MIVNGDCLTIMREMADASVDSLVCDPPAGIGFMGKAWDSDKGGRDQWVSWMTEVMRECHRILKPGAHGLVWALPRTSHWTATALENAGFEIRDVVTHLFGTGFPKSLDISKAIDKAAGITRPRVAGGQGSANAVLNARKPGEAISGEAISWQGWGTALKPASEHWILVRKPCSEKTVAANVLKHGTGGINIDGCRIEAGAELAELNRPNKRPGAGASGFMTSQDREFTPAAGRFPANLALDEEAAAMLDEQSGNLHGAGNKSTRTEHSPSGSKFGMGGGAPTTLYDRGGGASRFFYVAKASKSDRGSDNNHPTVKSTGLMSYLVRLITPPGGLVLDPFAGSGSTGVAAKREGFRFIGIEREQEYAAIAEKRLENAV